METHQQAKNRLSAPEIVKMSLEERLKECHSRVDKICEYPTLAVYVADEMLTLLKEEVEKESNETLLEEVRVIQNKIDKKTKKNRHAIKKEFNLKSFSPIVVYK